MRKMLNLTQAWTMTIIILAFLWLIVIVATAEAEVWRDEFNGEELIGWKPTGFFYTWKVQNGFLHVIQDRPVPPKRGAWLEALQLTAIQGPHQRLTIRTSNLKTIRSVGFGVALGKIFPDVPGETRFHYVFFTNSIYGRRFGGVDGTSGPFLVWAPTHPGTIWATLELKEMKLIFNAGRFQMYANGELRADFEDPHFDQIELISFAMWGSEQPGAEGWVDSFEIFDSALGIEPRGKLAITWGGMKKKQ